jgi:hypothetical protein
MIMHKDGRKIADDFARATCEVAADLQALKNALITRGGRNATKIRNLNRAIDIVHRASRAVYVLAADISIPQYPVRSKAKQKPQGEPRVTA